MTFLSTLTRKRSPVVPEIVEHDGPVKRVRPARHVKATIRLPDGVGYDDIVAGGSRSSIIQRVEAAAGWPPNTIVAVPNIHNARFVNAILSDPRILRKPVRWEGPSWTNGASIADSISIGMYQDGTECEVEVPATQIQIMGQVGSGKSLGGAWNALAEMITRHDVVIWGIDIKKGLQTLGPLAPGLHRVATTPADAIDLLQDANNLITPRTNYLSSEGLGKWFRGCGIKYLVLWIEEAPYVMDALGPKGKKVWVDTVKAARSAGITVAWSLQRAGFTEISTIARGQATKWCFGVQDSKEANFGLSSAQKKAGCSPEKWGQRRPGMSYIDAPNIPESMVAMPLRAWWFGKDDSVLREHSSKFPWQDRPYDDLMAEYFQAKARGEIAFIDLKPAKKIGVAPVDSEGELSEPEPTRPTAKADIKATLNQKQRGAIGKKMVADFITVNAGRTVTTKDMLDIVETLGLTRPWINAQLEGYVKKGKINKHKGKHVVNWEILPIATD